MWMSRRPSLIALILVLIGSMAACSGGSVAPDTGSPSAPTAPATAGPATSGSASSPPSSAGAVMTVPWATVTLTDVRSGETFRIADLVAAGKVVFLEPMAVWCSKCRAQQERAVDAMARLDRTEVVWIGLDVETAESAEQLVAYSEAAGFDFSYAIADLDISRGLVEEFGDVVLNPPATNVIVIEPDGQVTHTTGGHSADEIVEIANAALA